jgi:hypothetical protein
MAPPGAFFCMSNHSIFKAWVPNIAERLSFKLIGTTNYPSIAYCARQLTGNKMEVVAFQERNLDDSVWPRFITKRKFQDSRFIFLLIGSWSVLESENQALRGRLYAFAFSTPLLSSLQQKIQYLNSQHPTERSGSYSNFCDELKLSDSALSIADFELARDGVFQLTLTEYPAPKLTGVPDDDARQDNRAKHQMAGGFYFFVKDICHAHKHHSPSSDRVIDIYPVQAADDLRWMTEIFSELRRRCITASWSNRKGSSNAAGILAYAESFQSVCKKRLQTSDAAHLIPQAIANASLERVRHSMVASQDTYLQSIQKIERDDSLFMTVAFGLISIILAYVGLLEIAGQEKVTVETVHPMLNTAVNIALGDPVYTGLALIIMTVILRSYFGRFRSIAAWVHDRFTFLFNAYDQTIAALLIAGIGALMFGVAYWLFSLSVLGS